MVRGGPMNGNFEQNSNPNSVKTLIMNSNPYIKKLKRTYFQTSPVIMPKIVAFVKSLNDGLTIDI